MSDVLVNPAPSASLAQIDVLESARKSETILKPSSLLELEPSAPIKKRSTVRLVLVLVALYLTLFSSALNGTIVSTAIPTICAEFSSAAGYAWIGGAYLLATGASAPIWAKVSDIWGRKPILLISSGLWIATCILCALAKNMPMLIVGRALQGTAGGGLIQLVNIIICDLFSLRSRALFIGLLEVMWAVAGGIGPVLGGVFSQYATWRWIFWINVPVGACAFALLALFLDVHNPRTRFKDGAKAVDWAGTFSMLGLVLMLLLGLNFGGVVFPWSSPKVIVLIAVGLLMTIVFVFSEKKLAKYPLVPLRLLTHRSNVACFIITFVHEYSVLSSEYYLPLYFQSVQQASPSRSGVLVLPFSVVTAVGGIVCGLLIWKTGRYLELTYIGLFLLTLGEGLLIKLGAESSLVEIVVYQIICGAGAGLLFEPPMIAIQALSSQDDVATAVGTLAFIRAIATSLAAVIGGVIFQNGMDEQSANLQRAGLSSSALDMLRGSNAGANIEQVMKIVTERAQQNAVKMAYASSMKYIWVVCTCLVFVGLISSLMMKRAELSKEHTETITGLKDEKTDVAET